MRTFGLKLACIAGLLFLLLMRVEIGINTSPSLPGKIFLTIKGLPPVRDGYVEYLIDRDIGRHKSGVRFVKIVKGLPGDVVTERNGSLFINEVFLAKPLTTYTPISSQVIGEQLIYTHGLHERSFDSRYLEHGLVKDSQVVGRSFQIF